MLHSTSNFIPSFSPIVVRTRARSAVALALTVLLLAACGKKEETAAPAKAEPPRPVRVMTVGVSENADAIYLPGEVRARFEQRYGFRVPGKIARRMVDVGQEVKAGQVLATLDSQDVLPAINAQVAQVEVARTDLKLQQSELRRQTELKEKGFVSGAVLERQSATTDAANARMKSAQSQLSNVQNSLNFQTLRADKAGVVVGIDAEAGSVVAAGQSIVRIAQLGEREITVNVPERAVSQMKSSANFLVVFDALPEKFFRARLRELAPSADAASRTYAARLSLLDASAEIKLGMSATVRSDLGANKAIVIPNSALYTRDNATRVWLVDRASETVKAVEVKLGASTNDGVAIASGLNAGDVLVTAGANLLQPGQKIRLIESIAATQNELKSASPKENVSIDKKEDLSKVSKKITDAINNGANAKEATKP